MPLSTRSLGRALSTLAALAASCLVPLGQAAPAAAAVPGAGTHQEIRNQHSTLCLDDYEFALSPGAEVRQWTCLEGANQMWTVRDLGNGYAEIENDYSDLCLDASGTGAGADVGQWTCHGGDNQQWRMTDVGGGWTEIADRRSGLCLDNDSFRQSDGARIQLWPCNGATVQRWRLTDPSVSRMTYTLNRSADPTPDEADAYARITDAMDRAVARYNRFNNTQRHLTVSYVPGVPTADATIFGNIRFGSDRSFMQEGVALHEIAHTVGVGTADAFWDNCNDQRWPSALPLLRSWDGPDATINCGGGHMWPYGLNYPDEYTELNFDRQVKLIQAMHHDGM